MNGIKTIEDVKERNILGSSNFDEIMNASMKALEERPDLVSERGMDIGDTPISPMLLESDYTPIILSANVMPTVNEMVEKINVPETAKEYMFVLLGRKATLNENPCYLIDQMVDCTSQDGELSNRMTQIDQEKIGQTLRTALANGYDFISIGHTHPNIPQDERKTTIASCLPDDVRRNEYIREPGLNLSLSDFAQYDYIFHLLESSPNIKTAMTVIMFNGEMTMVSREGESLTRSVIIMDGLEGKDIPVSSKEQYNMENTPSF